VAEASLSQSFSILIDLDCPGDAPNISHHISSDFGLERLLQGNVTDCQPTARLKNPCDFTEHRLLVGSEIDHAVADHHVY
jgi:hypothetical protein